MSYTRVERYYARQLIKKGIIIPQYKKVNVVSNIQEILLNLDKISSLTVSKAREDVLEFTIRPKDVNKYIFMTEIEEEVTMLNRNILTTTNLIKELCKKSTETTSGINYYGNIWISFEFDNSIWNKMKGNYRLIYNIAVLLYIIYIIIVLVK
jgi:hypothetical protein